MLNCPFCAEIAQEGINFSYNFYSCSKCGSLFRKDVNEKVIHQYDSTYYGDRNQKFSIPFYQFLRYLFHSWRWKRIKNFFKEGDYVMDVGCGHGDWLEFLLFEKICIVPIGVELPGYLEEVLNEKCWLTLVTTPFIELDCFHKKIKAVFFLHSFEHMREPIKVLDKSIEILDDKGFIYIAIPNINSLQYKIFRKNWLHLDPDYHVHLPSLQWMKEFFLKKGFVIQNQKQNHFLYSLVGWLFSPLNMLFPRNVSWENLKKSKDEKNNFIFFVTLIWSLIFFLPAVLMYILEVVFRKGATVEWIIVRNN
ncbi:MAG: class I SAM-dependent methyltransferase [Bacteroidales bacterium]|nr:class I SAM-dependent methyltransferase [Bacteroidales bacterium]